MSDDRVSMGQIRTVLADLTTAGTLQPEQAEAVLVRLRRRPTGEAGRQGAPAEVGGYVGGIFVFAAAMVIGDAAWDTFSTTTQVLALAVVGVLLLAIAAFVAEPVRGRTLPGARSRLTSVLVVLGGLSLAGSVGVAANPPWEEAAASLTAFVVAAVAYGLWRGPLLQLAAGASIAAVLTSAAARADAGTGVAGALLLALAAAWAGAVASVLPERTVGVVATGVVGLAGAETWAIDGSAFVTALGYLAMAVLAVGALGAYLRWRRTALVVVGVVVAAILVPQAAIDYSGDALGAAGSLLMVGLSIVGGSVLGLRLRATD